MAEATTLHGMLEFLSPSLAASEAPPAWPPDAFGLSAATLLESGAYLGVVSEWPHAGVPGEGFLEAPADRWCARLEEIGRAWRRSWSVGDPPEEVGHWWRVIRQHGDKPLAEIKDNRPLFCALLQLCAAADEASYSTGLGLQSDPFGVRAEVALLPDRRMGSSLCQDIHPSKLRVLPKFHTPQTGITVRSLSHHLALWTGADVIPDWFTTRGFQSLAGGPNPKASEEPFSLSLLLVPWPTAVTPKQFSAAKPAWGSLLNMPRNRFGFFNYHPRPSETPALDRLMTIYGAAEELTDHVDGVILPELALEASDYRPIRDWVTSQKSFLIAGVGSAGNGAGPGSNRVAFDVPTGQLQQKGKGHWISASQSKHHRWRLDRSQIVQYGLGGQLDPTRHWWEHIHAEDRRLAFMCLQSWLSACALVCEDLARQEPVGRLVRAVGPNLVIALLMDGPQLTSRWPARYATVLADDPGSSVLTFTSIGMCEFSRPAGKGPSRTVALWKDAYSGEAREIDLPPKADGILLNLVRRMDEEWSADGRSDGGNAGYPALAGVHPVFAGLA